MILTVTLNPVLDTTYFIDEFRPVYRTEAWKVAHLAGGKGNNAARAMKALGVPARSLTALGGFTGRRVAELLAGEGIEVVVAEMSGETRHQITVVDRDGEQRAFYAPNAPFTEEDAAEVLRRYEQTLPGVTAVCICGSAPGPAAPLFEEILRNAASRGLTTLLDSSGVGLREGLAAAPTIVKCNRAEARGLLGRTLDSPDDEWWALEQLFAGGARWAILTIGERGALFAAEGQRWSALPPEVAVINPIGSGDAMTAGLMAGLRRGLPPVECFRLGMAAAAANTQTWDACQIEATDVERLVPFVKITEHG